MSTKVWQVLQASEVWKNKIFKIVSTEVTWRQNAPSVTVNQLLPCLHMPVLPDLPIFQEKKKEYGFEYKILQFLNIDNKFDFECFSHYLC